MNDWDRLNRMAEHYKAEYPSGTRIMLLSMGEDMKSCLEDDLITYHEWMAGRTSNR